MSSPNIKLISENYESHIHTKRKNNNKQQHGQLSFKFSYTMQSLLFKKVRVNRFHHFFSLSENLTGLSDIKKMGMYTINRTSVEQL